MSAQEGAGRYGLLKRLSRSRKARVIALAAACWTSASVAVAGQSVWDEPIEAPDVPGMLADPKFQQSLADAISRENAARIERESNAARSERADSETAYADIQGTEALTLAQERFPGLMTASNSDLGLSDDARIVDFTSAYSARVRADGKTRLLISTNPIAVEESGQLRPIDLSLGSANDSGFEPERPAVDVVVPDVADDFLELPGAQLGVRPADAPARTARVAKDRVFFSEIETDTDYVATPTRSGAQMLWQLRSAQAPEQLGVDIDIPSDATVRIASTITGAQPQAAGTAEVVRDGKVTATLSAPIVLDADGVSVPSQYRFQDGELTIEVPHRGQDVHYPLLVDPWVDEVFGGGDIVAGCNQTAIPAGRWAYLNINTPMTPMCGSPETGEAGLFIYGGAGTYLSDSSGQWYWSAPSGAYIATVWFDGLRHYPVATYQFTGLGGPGGWSADLRHNYQNDVWGQARHWASSIDRAYTAYMGVYAVGTVYRPAIVAGVRGVNASIDDTDVPWIYSGPSLTQTGPQTRWIDDFRNGGESKLYVGLYGHDNTLGVKKVGVVGDQPNIQGVAFATFQHPCAGHRGSPCPKDWGASTIAINTTSMPEGRNWVKPYVRDIVDKERYGDQYGNVPRFDVRVDRSRPTIALSGELAAHANDGLASSATITAYVHDRPPSNPTGEGSGVQKVQLLIDGQVYDTPVNRTSACDNCDAGWTWTLPANIINGQHTIKVAAWDFLGNPSVVNDPHGNAQSIVVQHYPTSRAYGNAPDYSVDTDSEGEALSAAVTAQPWRLEELRAGLKPSDRAFMDQVAVMEMSSRAGYEPEQAPAEDAGGVAHAAAATETDLEGGSTVTFPDGSTTNASVAAADPAITEHQCAPSSTHPGLAIFTPKKIRHKNGKASAVTGLYAYRQNNAGNMTDPVTGALGPAKQVIVCAAGGAAPYDENGWLLKSYASSVFLKTLEDVLLPPGKWGSVNSSTGSVTASLGFAVGPPGAQVTGSVADGGGGTYSGMSEADDWQERKYPNDVFYYGDNIVTGYWRGSSSNWHGTVTVGQYRMPMARDTPDFWGAAYMRAECPRWFWDGKCDLK